MGRDRTQALLRRTEIKQRTTAWPRSLTIAVAAPVCLWNSRAWAVDHGNVDGTSSVGQIVWGSPEQLGCNGTPPGYCSGVLITPSWVATARHCVVGSTDKSCVLIAYNQPAFIDFSSTSALTTTQPYPTWGTPSDLNMQNPHGRSTIGVAPPQLGQWWPGGIPLFQIISPSDPAKDRGIDLAFIQLDSRIPLGLVQPSHPPLASTCPNDGALCWLVGYGATDEGNTNFGTRNSAYSGEWDFTSTVTYGASTISRRILFQSLLLRSARRHIPWR